MSAPAAIEASLVDMRQVGAHKAVKLTLHVPEEYAKRLVDIFGWPTGTNPVPVAVARLSMEAVPDRQADPKVVERKGGRLSRACALRCQEPEFATFLGMLGWKAEACDVPAFVRHLCGVTSRAELDHDEAAAATWKDLEAQFLKWRSDPRARG